MPHYVWKTCETCGGDGLAQIPGDALNSITCWHCGGTGKIITGELPETGESLDTIVPVVTGDLPATKDGVDAIRADVEVVRSDQVAMQTYLENLRTDLEDALTTVIQKLNQILAAVT